MPTSSTVFAFCEDQELPLFEQLRYRLGDWVADYAEGGRQDVLWSQSLTLKGHVNPFLVWAQPNDLSLEAFRHVRWGEHEKASQAQWLLGVQTTFAKADPICSYHQQLKLAFLASNQGPAFFDQNSLMLRSRSEVERLVSTQVPPRTTEVFSIHAVFEKQNLNAKDSKRAAGLGDCWLHTHGLQRTYTPDLELFDIPGKYGEVGGQLLNSVAEVLLGHPNPAPGQVLTIGHRLQVCYFAVADVLRDFTPRLGGPAEREDSEHNGRRLVLTAADPEAQGRFRSPHKMLRRLAEEEAVLYISKRETQRMARLALERWPNFGMLFARHRQQHPRWRFLCKLGLKTEHEEREHLWFEVLGMKPGQIRGKLLNNPLGIQTLKRNSEAWCDLSLLTDWVILTSLGRFNPESSDELWEAAGE